MEYKEPELYTHDRIDEIIQLDKLDDVCDMLCDMLVGVAYNEPNPEYAYELIYKFLSHKDIQVVGLATICIAHIASVKPPINYTS